MEQAKEMIRVGKMSGAVGTFANIDPSVEEHVCKNLGLPAVDEVGDTGKGPLVVSSVALGPDEVPAVL
jgi:hypothetical protein